MSDKAVSLATVPARDAGFAEFTDYLEKETRKDLTQVKNRAGVADAGTVASVLHDGMSAVDLGVDCVGLALKNVGGRVGTLESSWIFRAAGKIVAGVTVLSLAGAIFTAGSALSEARLLRDQQKKTDWTAETLGWTVKDGQPAQSETERLEALLSELQSKLGAANERIAAVEQRAPSIVPIGTVVAWPLKTDQLDPGWLPCDGRDDIRLSDYPQVENAVAKHGWGHGPYKGSGPGTFRVPDYRGYFLRGLDSREAGRDPGPRDGGLTVGSTQDEAVGPHEHGYTGHVVRKTGTMSGTTSMGFEPQNKTTPVLASQETRPKNVAVNWIVYVGPKKR